MKHPIDTLSRQDIEQGPLPLRALLENSFYYPAAGHDGCVIRDCNRRDSPCSTSVEKASPPTRPSTGLIVPAAITIIQPGSGWGFNWTNFWAADAPLAWAVSHHPVGKPAMIYLGKYGYEFDKLCWPGYLPFVRHVHNRYPGFEGDVTYWELIETNDSA